MTFRNLLIIATAFIFFTASWSLAATQKEKIDIVGKWEGKLSVSGGQLGIVFNINQKNEVYSASMDSPDQGAFGIEVGKVNYEKDNVTLNVPGIGGQYSGKLSEDGTSIKGTWSQGGNSLPLNLQRHQGATKPKEMKAIPLAEEELAQITGIWQGKLSVNVTELRIVLNVESNDDRTLKATIDSPDQGAEGIPVGEATFKSGKLIIKSARINAKYEGTLSDDGKLIDGTWTQGSFVQPMKVEKVKKATGLNRPQEPKQPFPYKEEYVRFENKEAGFELAGTLTYPKSGSSFPAVVLISGSGPQDRNEAIMGHKPFLVLADYFTRQGIAVLRYDDRGTHESGGKFAGATSADFATDAQAAINYLKTRKEINPSLIGLVGHSEGALIAPMIAAKSVDVAFMVMMAGPGVVGADLLVLQQELILKTMNVSEEMLKVSRLEATDIFQIINRQNDNEIAAKKIKEYSDSAWAKSSDALKEEANKLVGGNREKVLDANIQQWISPWYRFFLKYDPNPTLQKVKCPVLAINGEKDIQVDAKQNLPAIESALKNGGNTNFVIQEFPNLNHLFQTAETGSMQEYSKIEETIAPVALKTMSDWILRISKSKENG